MTAAAYIVLTPAIVGADGISEVTRGIVDALSTESVEVVSLAEAADESLPAHAEGAGGSKLRFSLKALARTGTASTAMVIVTHLHLAPAALPLVWRGARLIVFLHGVECWRRLSPMEATALKRAHRLLSNSRYTAERFKEANPAFRDREVRTCALGVAAQTVRCTEEYPLYALIVGRMMSEERYKGHDALLGLWPELLTRVPDARLVIAGDGDDRPRLQQKAQQLGLASVVSFEGKVNNERLAELYSRAAFFVMPSTGEGFGLAYLEAMRAGKPCIAAKGAAEEVIAHGRSGFIVDLASTELLRAIERLFTDNELRQNTGRSAAESFLQNFTRQHFCERFRVAVGLEKRATVCAG